MKAIVVKEFGREGEPRVRDWPVPSPGWGEIALRVCTIALNFPDVLVVAGQYQNLPEPPFVLGKEACGVVCAVGEGVAQFAVGDRVMATVECGAFGEVIAVQAAHCFPMPAGLSMQSAAAMGLVYQTAWFALLTRGQMKPTETVLVTGAAGGVGSAAIQLAKAMGCYVLAAVSTEEKAEFVRRQGADDVIFTTGGNLRDRIREQVHAKNNGEGADVVVEMVGGDVFNGCLRALAWCGRMVVVGFASGAIESVKANYILIKQISITGLHWSDYRDGFPHEMQAAQKGIFKLWSQKKIDPPIAHVLPFEEIGDAIRFITGRSVMGKVVLETEYGVSERLQSLRGN